MSDEVTSVFSLKDLPIYTYPLPGYIRLGHKDRLSVKYKPNKRLKRLKDRWHPTDIVILEVSDDQLDLLQPNNRQQLEQQLMQQIPLLQDLEAVTVKELKQLPTPQPQQRQHRWEDAVELVDVSHWPGHRLGSSNKPGAQGVQAVRAKEDFSRYSFIGWYKGILLDDKQYNKIKTAAEDHNWAKYSYSFTIVEDTPEGGASRVTEPGQVQQATTFNVDANCCLEGNPMAHILDYREFGPDWDRLDAEGSRALNATLLPISHNDTGKVYVAVIALRDISAGEEICIDYGDAYWEGVVANEKSKLVGKMTADSETVKELKDQLRQEADKAAALQQLQDGVCCILPVLYGFRSSLQAGVQPQFLAVLDQLTNTLQVSRQVGQQQAAGQLTVAGPDSAGRSAAATSSAATATTTTDAAAAISGSTGRAAAAGSTAGADAAADNAGAAAAAPDSTRHALASIGSTRPTTTAAATMDLAAPGAPGTGHAAAAAGNTLPAAVVPDSTRHALGAICSRGPATTAAATMDVDAGVAPAMGHAAAALDNTLPAHAAPGSIGQAPPGTGSLGVLADAVVMAEAGTRVVAGKEHAQASSIASSISLEQVAAALDRPMDLVAASNSLRQAAALHHSTEQAAVAAVSAEHHHATTHSAGQAADAACVGKSDHPPAKRRRTAELSVAAVPQAGLGDHMPIMQAVQFPPGKKKRHLVWTRSGQLMQKQLAPQVVIQQPATANALAFKAAQPVPGRDGKKQQQSPLAVPFVVPERLRDRLGPLPGSRQGSGDLRAAVDEADEATAGGGKAKQQQQLPLAPIRPPKCVAMEQGQQEAANGRVADGSAAASESVLPAAILPACSGNNIFDEFAEVWFYKDDGLVVGPKSIRMLRRLIQNLPLDLKRDMDSWECFTKQQPPEYKRLELLLRFGDANAPDQ